MLEKIYELEWELRQDMGTCPTCGHHGAEDYLSIDHITQLLSDIKTFKDVTPEAVEAIIMGNAAFDWRAHDRDMKWLSKKFPNFTFKVTCTDAWQVWRSWWKDGECLHVWYSPEVEIPEYPPKEKETNDKTQT